jgi:hypothetical protein
LSYSLFSPVIEIMLANALTAVQRSSEQNEMIRSDRMHLYHYSAVSGDHKVLLLLGLEQQTAYN